MLSNSLISNWRHKLAALSVIPYSRRLKTSLYVFVLTRCYLCFGISQSNFHYYHHTLVPWETLSHLQHFG